MICLELISRNGTHIQKRSTTRLFPLSIYSSPCRQRLTYATDVCNDADYVPLPLEGIVFFFSTNVFVSIVFQRKKKKSFRLGFPYRRQRFDSSPALRVHLGFSRNCYRESCTQKKRSTISCTETTAYTRHIPATELTPSCISSQNENV